MTTVVALQKAVEETLGLPAGTVILIESGVGFVCNCGQCGVMKMTGGLVQYLYERQELNKLKEAHDERIKKMLSIKTEMKHYVFKQAPQPVLDWLKELGVDWRTVYRVFVRKTDEGANVHIWQMKVNENGKRYITQDGQLARQAIQIKVKEAPAFVEEFYGFPMEQHDDDKLLPEPA